MNRLKFQFLLVLLSIFTLTGCIDTCPMAWSPSGDMMALFAGEGLQIATTKGYLSPKLLSHVRKAKWLPDSKHILIERVQVITSWKEAFSLLTEQQKDEAVGLAKLFEQQISLPQDIAKWDDDKIASYPPAVIQSAVLYLKENKNIDLKTKWHSLPYIQASPCAAYVLDIIEFNLQSITAIKELWRGFDEIDNMQIAPDTKYVSIAQKKISENENGSFNISVVSLELPEKPIKVAESISKHTDWSTDSRSIIFFQAENNQRKEPLFGSLSSLRIRDDRGFILQSDRETKKLVYLIGDDSFYVCCLKDGRIIFTAPTVELPTTCSDFSHTKNIFSVRPGDQFSRRLMSKEIADDLRDISFMQANSDCTNILLYNSNKGKLGVLSTDGGNYFEREIRSAWNPCWRNSDEVCFVRPKDNKNSKKQDADVVLFSVSTGKERIISNTWPRSSITDPGITQE